jgi:predicted ABC-type ATPase
MNIYLIAGPPGIGKSTSSIRFIPTGTTIIDQDLAAYQYRKEGFGDYKHLATISSNQNIKSHLFEKKDFALELNLGFESHYDYLKSIAYFNPENRIHLILYFTDFMGICLKRADIRHKNGGHLVESTIIKEMYENTFPLLKANISLFSTMSFLDVSEEFITQVSINHIPNWIKDNDLIQYLTV